MLPGRETAVHTIHRTGAGSVVRHHLNCTGVAPQFLLQVFNLFGVGTQRIDAKCVFVSPARAVPIWDLGLSDLKRGWVGDFLHLTDRRHYVRQHCLTVLRWPFVRDFPTSIDLRQLSLLGRRRGGDLSTRCPRQQLLHGHRRR